jgi:death on curing protein
MPVWLTVEMVVRIHDDELFETGGSPGLRDRGLLESALARPQNRLAYNSGISVFDLAATYCVGIAKNHAFIDGNKRTVLGCR